MFTVDRIPVRSRHFASAKEIKKWPHLLDVNLPEVDERQVNLLIGNDRPEIVEVALETRVGKKGEPVAVKTPLGWTVCGPMEKLSNCNVSVNFVSNDYEVKLELVPS